MGNSSKKGIPIDKLSDYFKFCDEGFSYDLFSEYRKDNEQNISWGYHFDASNVAAYLKKIAIERGVECIDDVVKCINTNRNIVENIIFESGQVLDVDFVFDCTGFRQEIICKLPDYEWNSFSEKMLVDSALPFIIERDSNIPSKPYTTAKAMKYGWMWDIPTDKRNGCGYVYSSKYISSSEAQREIEDYLGKPISPIKNIKFKSGVLEKVFIGNCMAVGLSAGFVEPLEAKAIAQIIAQLDNFRHISKESGNVIPDRQVESINRRTKLTYLSLLDFIVMHYQTKRCDTDFWLDMKKLDFDRLKETKEILAKRLPRESDCRDGYFSLQVFFKSYSYHAVYSPIGLIDNKVIEEEMSRIDSCTEEVEIEIEKILCQY